MPHSLTTYFRPDNYPDWVLWREFDPDSFRVIGQLQALTAGGVPSARAGFVPRLSFGKPSDATDPISTNRRLRRGYNFQVRFQGVGHVTIERFRLHAQRLVESSRAINVTHAK